MARAKILVVEDEKIVALEIQTRLRSLGYKVPITVFTGKEAIRQADTMHPDLVLMDIKLRGDMDGIEAAEHIKTMGIPVIFLTAFVDDKTLQRAKITEPYGYLLKPFEERELHSTIEIALHRSKLVKEIREQKTWLSTILRSIGDAVIVTDPRGCITFMNPVAESLTGWKQKSAIDEPVSKIFHVISDQTQKQIVAPVKDVLQKGIALAQANHSTLITKSNQKISIDYSGAPCRDEDGRIIGAVLTFSDISERRKKEDALKNSEERFRELFTNMSNGVAVYEVVGDGKDYIFRNFNRAAEKIDKIRKKDVLNKSIHAVFPNVEETGLLEVFKRVWENGKAEHYPIMQYTDDRISGWRENDVFKLPSGEIVAIYSDVTVRVLAEERLRESEQKFRSVVETSTDIVFRLSNTGLIEYLSPRVKELYG